MATRTYENFDLVVEELEPDRYRARVTSSPVGAGASSTFALPFDPTGLENLLLKLDPGRSQMRRASADPRPQASTELGGGLFDAAFGDEVLLAWTRSQDATRPGGEGLRIRLQLTDAPQLAGLPWELLYDRRSHTYLAQSERTPVVRYLEVSQPPRPRTVDGPLRILVVLSSPTDLPELDVEAEWRRLQDSLREKTEAGLVQLDRLPSPTTTALAAWLRSHEVHVLHVVGHGDYDEQAQEGVLYFCDPYGRSLAVPPSVLGPYLHDHDPLRLVFLNACQSGRLGAADPFSGMAQRLVQQDCTAVVAMQFPISDGAATAFTGEFYAAVADGMPVDQATTSARKALLAGYASEWATPVLYLNAPDGQVFASIAPIPAPTPAPSGPVVLPTTPNSGPIHHDPPAHVGRGRVVAATVAAALVLGTVAAVTVSRASSGTTAGSPEAVAQSNAGAAPTAPGAGGTPSGAPGVSPVVPGVASPAAASGPASASPSLRPIEGPALTARRLASAPTIDGKPDEWPAMSPVICDQLVAGTTATVKGLWFLGWDANNLYLFADVIDPEVTDTFADRPAQLFKGDGVTLQFGAMGAPVDGISLTPGDVSLSIGPRAAGGAATALTLGTAGRFDVDAGRPATAVTAATSSTPTGYAVEAKVPWSVIQQPDAGGLTTKSAGAQFGANLFANDADPTAGSATGIRSRVGNNGYSADHTATDGGYRRYWGSVTLQG